MCWKDMSNRDLQRSGTIGYLYELLWDRGTVLKVADITELEGIACILEDKIINKITLTNCVSSLKYSIKFNADKHKGLQLNRNKTWGSI